MADRDGRRGRAPAPVRRVAAAVVGRVRRLRGALLVGDRPFQAMIVVVLTLGGLMVWAPLGHYLDGRERVDVLETKQAALDAEIARLEARRDDLNDPEHIELLAREQLGLVQPGEIAYVVVTPEPERPQVAPSGEVDVADRRWYLRLWEALSAALP